jgi:transcriptional regulator with XRE-family HTH domain
MHNLTPAEIKELRKFLHMTQMEFAAALGVSFATANRWESGKAVPPADRIEKMLMLNPKQLYSDIAKLWVERLTIAIASDTFRKEVAAMVKELRRR